MRNTFTVRPRLSSPARNLPGCEVRVTSYRVHPGAGWVDNIQAAVYRNGRMVDASEDDVEIAFESSDLIDRVEDHAIAYVNRLSKMRRR